MANNACRTGVILHCPPIAWAGERRIQLIADKRLDELANPFAQTALDRIEPVVEKVRGGIGCKLERSDFMVTFVMAWSPFRRFNAG